jgi:hypothetical protein
MTSPTILMDKILQEIVAQVYEDARLKRIGGFPDRNLILAEILAELESEGDAMWYLDSKVKSRGGRLQTCEIILRIFDSMLRPIRHEDD